MCVGADDVNHMQQDDDWLDLDAISGRDAIRYKHLWQRHGVCATDADVAADLFHPGRGTPQRRLEAAKTACGRCRVQAPCLEYALSWPEKHGIWGGTSERERRELRRARAATPETQLPAVAENVATCRQAGMTWPEITAELQIAPSVLRAARATID